MFFLHSQLQFATVAKGCQVQFSVVQGQKGVEAGSIRLAPKGTVAAGPEYFGQIKSWNHQKGWGFIECADTHALYGKDVFVMRSAVSGGETCTGAQVWFSVDTTQRGPEALNVRQTFGSGKGTAGDWGLAKTNSWSGRWAKSNP